jgi:Trypsin
MLGDVPRPAVRSWMLALSGAALAACGGAPAPASSVSHEALQGAPACEAGAAPSSVAIIGTRDDGLAYVYCTGTLIAPDVVLAAAHCITETPTVAQHVSLESDLRFLPGAEPDLRDQTLAASVAVRRSAPHPSYDGGSHAHDVGLFFLDAPIASVTPAIVLESADDAALGDGAGVAVSFAGYGYDEEDVFGLKRCAQATLAGGDGTHLYVETADGVPQGCNGDSGGGLFVDVPTAHARTDRVAGVASYTAPGCAEFTGFADVRLDRAFLDEQLQDCADRAWCEVPGLVPAAFYDPPVPAEGEGEGEGPNAPAGDGASDAPGGCGSGSAAPLAVVLIALAPRRRPRWRRHQ